MSDNIWKDFAKLNGMSEGEFFNEIILVAMAVMSMKLDDEESNAIKITKGNHTLMLIDNDKD